MPLDFSYMFGDDGECVCVGVRVGGVGGGVLLCF